MTAATFAGVGRKSVSRERDWGTSAAVLLLPFVAVVGVAAASGGFNATSFGWTALAFAWFVIIAVTVVTPAWGALDVAWLSVAAASLPLHLRLGRVVGVGRDCDRQRTALARVPPRDHGRSARRSSRADQPLARRAGARRGRRCRLLARDAALSGSLRCLRRDRRLPPLRADRLLERTRHLRRDRGADRIRRCGRRARARAARPHRDRARPAHRDAVLHVQPRRVGGARGRTARDVRVEPAAPSSAGRCPCPGADPGCRGADRLSSLRADAPVGRRQRGCATQATGSRSSSLCSRPRRPSSRRPTSSGCPG